MRHLAVVFCVYLYRCLYRYTFCFRGLFWFSLYFANVVCCLGCAEHVRDLSKDYFQKDMCESRS